MASMQPRSTRRLVLHVGLHKTGTTYLQGLFRANQAALAAQGVYYPHGEGAPSQTTAAWDLLGRRAAASRDRRQVGQWDALSAAVNGSPLPTALVSAESLSVVTARQAARAAASFPGREVTVVLTCRDLGRLLVSAWQESIKNDRTVTWPEFVSAVRDPRLRGRDPARGFWLNHDLPTIAATWSKAVPAEQVHIVTLPPAGTPQSELVARMGQLVGFDPAGFVEPARRANESLGVAATELLRRLNEGLGHRLNHRQHTHLVRSVLAPAVAAEGVDERYALPPEELPWVETEARRQIEAIRAGGHPVVGDLDDLLPRLDNRARRPDDASTEELLRVATLALVGASERAAAVWWDRHRDEQPRVAPTGVRSRLTSTRRAAGFRGRALAAELADRNRLVAGAAAGYLRRRARR